ncbi:MAG: aspartate--tRNA ligase, partial [Lentisphaeria bacterium]|nr:aspartate--tRNA ligase [Lentisphaeria bacterium]
MGTTPLRTHTCNELNAAHVGQTVRLAGWVNSCRDLGGMVFIDLRDREGVTQLFLDPVAAADLMPAVRRIREEFVVGIEGLVRPRPANMVNRERATGAIEVEVKKLDILNAARPMPFNLDDPAVGEDLRLKYRYLDMRRSGLVQNLRLRHRITKIARDALDHQGFVEVETPILSKSTPEGARDYLVPSRVHPGTFNALPQAPQQYKQLLMVGGLERYFQVARCFRDEDLRADRQPEFTQIDLEMSFVDVDDIIAVIEDMIARVMKGVHGLDLKTPFPRLTYAEAMDRYGSDKPDTRFAMELVHLGDCLAASEFRVFQETLAAGGVVKAICAKGQGGASRKQIDAWTETAKLFGAKGLAWMKLADEGLAGGISKFLSPAEQAAVVARLGAETGDLILVVADQAKVANAALGRLRLDLAATAGLIPQGVYNFLWVVDFPLLEFDAESGRYVAVHHPFTRPHDADL